MNKEQTLEMAQAMMNIGKMLAAMYGTLVDEGVPADTAARMTMDYWATAVGQQRAKGRTEAPEAMVDLFRKTIGES